MYFYQVCFNLPTSQSYTYSSVLPDLLHRRVIVSFGKQSSIVGFVESKFPSTSEVNKSHNTKFIIKEVSKVVDEQPIISQNQLEVAKWISFYYLCSFGEALSLFFSFSSPSKAQNKNKSKKLVDETKVEKQLTVLNIISKEIILNMGQEQVYNIYQSYVNQASLEEKKLTPFLLHGVTGSGKTFFYLKVIQDQLKQGKQALILVPEITLTFQLYETCIAYFDPSVVAVYHSKVTEKGKRNIRNGVKDQSIKLVISTRSGLFLDYANLGVMVIDEEHEGSYKSEQTPRYQVKRVAHFIAHQKNIPLIYGSATPTVDTYYLAQQKNLVLLELCERYAGFIANKIKVLDNERSEMILPEIQKKIFQALEAKEQIIIYINQRGYSSSVVCKECGGYSECPNCDVTLNYYQNRNILLCHYCGFTEPFLHHCIKCGKKELNYVKLGTENMYEFLKTRFSSYRVGRFDSDTLKNTKEIKKKLEEFRKGEIDILVGTQMIIKGHDFKRISLVVVLDPEKYLLFPDYFSNERCYSHLIQVAGRGGRFEKGSSLDKSEVLIQTQLGTHFAIESAVKQDYQSFYQTELKHRKEFNYPPFVRLIRLVFRGRDEEKVKSHSEWVKGLLVREFLNKKGVTILGPAPCLIERQNNYYRWNIVIKVKQLTWFISCLQSLKENFKNAKVYTEVDIDPVHLF